ncbi:MAG: (2Fe-2S)-binding protein [Acidobacteriota bacterium]
MAERFAIRVDGETLEVEPGWTVAVALWNAGRAAPRRSVTGGPRGPLCAMGICFECRVTIDGVPHRRGCLTACAPGMEVRTGG